MIRPIKYLDKSLLILFSEVISLCSLSSGVMAKKT